MGGILNPLSLCVQVVAEDSYLNEVQNSGKWEAMLLSVLSLHPASSYSILSLLLLFLQFNPHSDSDAHEAPLFDAPSFFYPPCFHTHTSPLPSGPSTPLLFFSLQS